MSENFDVFDVNYKHIGKVHKDVVHKTGLWHQTFHCWIVNPKKGTVVFQIRSAINRSNSNKFDISSAGHLSAGEEPIEGIREIEEELGLKIDKERLIFLGAFRGAVNRTRKDGFALCNREFNNVYLLEDDTSTNDYVMQPEEVDGVFEMKIEDGLKLFSKEVKEVEVKGVMRENKEEFTKKVIYRDFVRHGKKYYLKVFIMAERLLEGKKYLAI